MQDYTTKLLFIVVMELLDTKVSKVNREFIDRIWGDNSVERLRVR